MKKINLALGFSFLLASSIAKAQQPIDPKTQEMITEGQKYFTAGDCKKAYPTLKEAYLRSYKTGLLTSIAQCAEFLQDNFEALGAYCAYQKLEPDSPYKDTIEKSITGLKKSTKSDCPAESEYLPPTPKTNDPLTPTSKPTETQTVKEAPIFLPIGFGLMWAGFGAAAWKIRIDAKNDQALSKADRTRGLLFAVASDVSFAMAGLTLYLTVKTPDAPQGAGASIGIQIPLP